MSLAADKALKELKALKRKRSAYFKKWEKHDHFHICYSTVWCGKDDIRAEIENKLHEFFKLL